MTIYVTYEPKIGNTWGCIIMDQNMTLGKVEKEVARIKTECAKLGVSCTFRTSNDIMTDLLSDIENARRKMAMRS